MTGMGAWYILKGRNKRLAEESVKMGLVVGLIASLLQLGTGHYHAIQVAETQPEKLAAVEGLWETQTNAPALLFGIPDGENERMKAELKIPGLLSLLAFGSFDAEVMGLKDVPPGERPPLGLTFYPFHIMVVLGMYFIGLTALGVLLLMTKRLFTSRFFMYLAMLSIPLPFIANELGWITAEVGRQPWIVYKVLKTQDAVSIAVPAGQILFSIILFCAIYALLFAVWIHLLRREFRRGLEEEVTA
jgi:cytochrome d ubiquinol oxidase subunit I